jgi:phospholipase C
MAVDRRQVLLGASCALLPVIARAASIDADVRTGTIADVEHVVVFMQENRSFDHYFGAMRGVRGFGDRFPIPLADAAGRKGATCWTQLNAPDHEPSLISPFPLNTAEDFRLMRVEGTPHTWPDAQAAWDEGRMGRWPAAKGAHAMGYFTEAGIPFQYALADAFTICDAYHCSIQTGTNSNRIFLWTGTNDPSGKFGGPAISNSHDNLASLGGDPRSYEWATYPERLLAAGVTWRIYQDMADNFTDNPTAGFKSYRDSFAKVPGSDPRLAALALSTRKLAGLREDVLSGQLPQVSWIIAGAKDSEHPGPSSPAQGADYTARVIEALTADPKVWARTVLLLMFDENDGFFDHMPPPAPPSLDGTRPSDALGGSTVDLTGEHHLVTAPSEASAERKDLMGRPYGLGPRVPTYVISPWSRGGWVNSQVFDHTSVIQFLEKRFGVMEPNISPWRRAVCGDLTTAFDFKEPNAPFPALPPTQALAARAARLPGRTTPDTPTDLPVPMQPAGARPSRALPYMLNVSEGRFRGEAIVLVFQNDGSAAAVFHVYDRLRLDRPPRRYTVGAGGSLNSAWEAGRYDLWVLGPNGFHRHFVGDANRDEPTFAAGHGEGALGYILKTDGPNTWTAIIAPNAYAEGLLPRKMQLARGRPVGGRLPLAGSSGWYDFTVRIDELGYFRRLAGRLETGAHSISDPAMGGPALMEQAPLAYAPSRTLKQPVASAPPRSVRL